MLDAVDAEARLIDAGGAETTLLVVPAPFAARAWDRFLAEGWKPVYQIGVALLAARERELLALDFEGLMGALRRLPETVDVERTLGLALRLRVITSDVRDVEKRFGGDVKPQDL